MAIRISATPVPNRSAVTWISRAPNTIKTEKTNISSSGCSRSGTKTRMFRKKKFLLWFGSQVDRGAPQHWPFSLRMALAVSTRMESQPLSTHSAGLKWLTSYGWISLLESAFPMGRKMIVEKKWSAKTPTTSCKLSSSHEQSHFHQARSSVKYQIKFQLHEEHHF